MCGICGTYHYRGGQADRALVTRMTGVLRHRGPDDADVWAEGPAALGQRRLAIVDLSAGGHQPMPNEDRTIWVTFNGELYNWPEVRPELAARGHRFRGDSDTEMLLHLWEDHGFEMLQKLRGMFAFALVDRTRQTLLLARDRLGKKPLYWHDDGARIAFASEAKALLQDPAVALEVDPRAIADYLALQYVPAPRTIWRGVHKLPPGHALLCDAGGPRVVPYWTLPAGPVQAMGPGEAVERVRTRLAEAVRIRLMSDVPLGAFLSGGIDSSAVVAMMTQASSAPVRTFSIGFEDEDVSELAHARAVAAHLGTDHHEFVVRPDALALLPRLVWGMDEPFADASMIPTSYVCEMARSQVTVALSGDGGDEAFAGYVTYPWARGYARLDRIPRSLRQLLALPAAALAPAHPLGRKLHRASLDVLERHLEAMSAFPPRALRAVLSPALAAEVRGHDAYAEARRVHAAAAGTLGPIPALAHLDARTYMTDDVLVKVDRTSMQHSLEVRAPLLDHVLIEEVARLPFDLKLRGDVTKWVLREAVRPLLPAPILGRGKQGFGVPLVRWFGAGFGRFAAEVLHDKRCRERGWLDPTAVDAVLGGHGWEPGRHAQAVWTLVCLELWAQCYLDRPRAELVQPTDGPFALHPAVAGTAVAGLAPA